MSLLNDHPQAWCYNFKTLHKKSKNHRKELINRLGKQYLDEYVYHAFPGYMKAVGMKIFYEHTRYPYPDGISYGPNGFGPIWDYLAEDTNVKVIQLTRKNLLRVYLSEQLARRSNQWKFTNNNRKPNFEPIELKYQDCLRFFELVRQHEQIFGSLFSHHPKCHITYKELTYDADKVINNLLEFLGLRYLNLSTPLKKQNITSLQQSIWNYHELKEKFSNTQWSSFFDE